MTLAAILAIVIIAALNAWASLALTLSEKYSLQGGQGGYFRWCLKVEVFWRAFVTNLSFGGASLSLAIIAFQSTWGFWDLNNPILPLLANFVMGLVAPHELKEVYEKPSRAAWVVVGVGIAVYLYAALTAFSLYTPIAAGVISKS